MNRSRAASLLALALMLAGAAIMVYPYLYAVGGSLKTRAEFAADKRSVIPPRYQPATLYRHFLGARPDAALAAQWRDWPPQRNYREAITFGHLDRYLGNSFFYALIITAVSLFFNMLAAYAFARMQFPG